MIKNILIGWWNKLFNKNEELATKRLQICDKCPHKIDSGTTSWCDICGCELDAKARVEEEICHDGRW